MSLERVTKEVLRKYGLSMKKSLGQNFLIDDNVLTGIVDGSDIDENSLVLEIGPGIGTLSRAILNRGAKLLSVELDSTLIPVLNSEFAMEDRFQLVEGDILKQDLVALAQRLGSGKIKVIANIPYYITSPILERLLEHSELFSSITVMVQKEVAKRIVSDPGGKEYGVLSIAIGVYAKAYYLMEVPNYSFIPSPKVDSAVVKLMIRDEALVDSKLFFPVVKAAFSKRRKIIRNSLQGGLGISFEKIDTALQKVGIDPIRRAETVSIDEYIRLAEELGKLNFMA